MDVYIKLVKKATVTGRKTVFLKDVADVFAAEGQGALEKLVLLTIPTDKKSSYLITGLDVVKAVTACQPKATVNPMGETDVVVEYVPRAKAASPVREGLKVLGIALILFAGSAVAIMSFHNDAQMPHIFRTLYQLFMGKPTETPYLVEIPYAIGLLVGIVVFFNHVSRWRLTQDPTPVQVQMTTYEEQVIASTLDSLSKQAAREEGSS